MQNDKRGRGVWGGGCISQNHSLFFSSFLSICSDVRPRVALCAQAESGQVIGVVAGRWEGEGAGGGGRGQVTS